MMTHKTAPDKDSIDLPTALEQAWARQLNLLDLFTLADQLTAEGKAIQAIVLYQTWLSRNRTTHDHLAWFNLGVTLLNLHDAPAARDAYSKAVLLAPDFLQPRFNLGIAYEQLGQHEQARTQWLHVVNHASPHEPDQRSLLLLALNNLGRNYEDRGQLAEALAYLERSLLIEANQPDVIQHWVFLRAKQCIWPVYQPINGLDEATLRQYTSALAMVSLSEDPLQQLAAAKNYVANRLPPAPPRLSPTKPYGHKRLRIGYCSSDLCSHPVAMLTVELFELHDRERFEVFVYDWSPEDGSQLRQRIITAAEHFERIHQLTDEAAAHLIRSHEIDILIDLQGQTAGARAGILAYRPAPIQITYLGLPATTALPSIDYVIADRFLIPEEAKAFYTEEPLYLPDVYQVSDRQREHGPIPTRSDCGLPENCTVFCCFNNNYKFNPETFATWLRILERVPDSVLWLLADNASAQENLRSSACASGIDPQRLIFAPRVLPADYLARFAVADLFLDTYPFNAGTTCNDALWMGLPVLTRSGSTFASRMAGALLNTVGLPDLICTTLEEYENRAVSLANQPSALKDLREKLLASKQTNPLFDTPRLISQLETALLGIVDSAE